MQKVSENIVLRSISNELICCIQSKGDYDYREVIQVENSGKVKCCISTDKFISIESETISSIVQGQTSVTFTTSEGEYRLPIMRERGVFMVSPEVELPKSEPEKTWESDFSKKSITTRTTSNSISQASGLVVIGENFVARSINHILEEYGDSSTAVLSISPLEYSLIQKLGKVNISYYSSGEASFVGETGEVRVKSSRPPLSISSVESSLSSGKYITKVDLSKLKFKSLSKFTLDKVYLVLNSGTFSIVTDSARKTVEAEGILLDEAITLEMAAGDLKHLVGEITIFKVEIRSRVMYVIKSVDGEKVTYILVSPSYRTMSW